MGQRIKGIAAIGLSRTPSERIVTETGPSAIYPIIHWVDFN